MSEEKRNLMRQLARVDALLHRYHGARVRQAGSFSSPHRGQGRVLKLLNMQPEIPQKELAYLLDIRAQSLGELLAKLERAGYITRTPSEEDKRMMIIRLTEEGKKAAGELDEGQDPQEDIFSCLNEEEQAQLGDYLSRLIQSLEKSLCDKEGAAHHDHGGPHFRGGMDYHPGGGHFRGRPPHGMHAFAGPMGKAHPSHCPHGEEWNWGAGGHDEEILTDDGAPTSDEKDAAQ